MTTTNTIASRQTVATQMRSLVQKSKPEIQILLNNREGPSISTFSTGDKIEGEVLMTAPHDCRFDDISITFEGSVKTYVEKLAATSAANSRSKAFHNFLKLKQPIEESSLPVPRVAEAGKTYRFPFTFVVPGHLLPHACNHRVESNQVHDAHLLLPPSLNDNTSTASDGTSLLDDLAPMMSIISYSIKAEVTRYSTTNDHAITLSVKSQKVHIIPSVPEAPPLSIDGQSEEYVLRREKGLRRGLFKGKLGRLSISALQPKSLRLPAPLSPSAAAATTQSSPPTTMATIALRFDPADAQAKPPKLGQLNAKLHAQTYFASRPMRDFPTPSSAMYDAHRGLYDDTITLSSRCVEGAQWTAHSTSDSITESSSMAAAAAERRDSAFSTLTTSSSGSSVTALPTSSADKQSTKSRTTSIYYTASLLVPLTLPRNKSFVPSFHSCLVARLYQLDLSLSVPSPSTTSPATTLKLRLPLQLSAQGPLDLPSAGLPAADEEPALQRLVDEDLEAVFRPRQISVPRAELLENGRLGPRAQPSAPTDGAPPGYSSFAGAPEEAQHPASERESELDMRRPTVGVWG